MISTITLKRKNKSIGLSTDNTFVKSLTEHFIFYLIILFNRVYKSVMKKKEVPKRDRFKELSTEAKKVCEEMKRKVQLDATENELVPLSFSRIESAVTAYKTGYRVIITKH
jgi:hypothetical protein